MGERQVFQPLTRGDRATVLVYRAGIVLSTIALCGLSYLVSSKVNLRTGPETEVLLSLLYVSVGMSVFFIHLYVSAFKRFLIGLYIASLTCLAVLLILGKGSLSEALVQGPAGPLLLLPLSGCLGFITAKEAFCFRLIEGYLLAMIMPIGLLLAATGLLSGPRASWGLLLVAVLLVLFMFRKAFMPLAYDIGDKSAYH